MNEHIIVAFNTITPAQLLKHFQDCAVSIDGRDLQNHIAKLSSLCTIVELWDSNALVGLCACYMNDLATRTAYITHIAIVPAYQGRGYGRQLLEHTIATARARGFVRLNLEVLKDNTPALHLYQSHHFTIIEDHAAKWLMSLAL